jgi:hypothetical protein
MISGELLALLSYLDQHPFGLQRCHVDHHHNWQKIGTQMLNFAAMRSDF